MVAFCVRLIFSAKCSVEMPARTDDDNAAERGVENAFVSMLDDTAEEPYPDDDAGEAAEEHVSHGAVSHLFAPHLDGDNDEFDDGGVDEGCSHRERKRHMQEEHENRRSDCAGTDSGDC